MCLNNLLLESENVCFFWGCCFCEFDSLQRMWDSSIDDWSVDGAVSFFCFHWTFQRRNFNLCAREVMQIVRSWCCRCFHLWTGWLSLWSREDKCDLWIPHGIVKVLFRLRSGVGWLICFLCLNEWNGMKKFCALFLSWSFLWSNVDLHDTEMSAAWVCAFSDQILICF